MAKVLVFSGVLIFTGDFSFISWSYAERSVQAEGQKHPDACQTQGLVEARVGIHEKFGGTPLHLKRQSSIPAPRFMSSLPPPGLSAESFASQRDHRVDCRSSPGGQEACQGAHGEQQQGSGQQNKRAR